MELFSFKKKSISHFDKEKEIVIFIYHEIILRKYAEITQ